LYLLRPAELWVQGNKKALENATKAKAKGLRIGYYHFCRPLIQKVAALLLTMQRPKPTKFYNMTGLPKARSPTGA